MFMEILDATVIAPAAPHIAESLGVAAVDINVAITAYVLTLAVLIPVSGWLADRFGARRVFLSCRSRSSPSPRSAARPRVDLTILTATRVLQGIGGAMMVPVGRLVVLRTTAKAELVKAIAYLTWPALVAPVLAPAAGWPAQHLRVLAVDLPDQRAARDRGPRARPAAGARRPCRAARPPRPRGFPLTALGVAALVIGLEALGKPVVDAGAR